MAHVHLTPCLKTLGFKYCLAIAYVFRFAEKGRVATVAVAHVDDIFVVGRKSRCACVSRRWFQLRTKGNRDGMEVYIITRGTTREGYSDDITPEKSCR